MARIKRDNQLFMIIYCYVVCFLRKYIVGIQMKHSTPLQNLFLVTIKEEIVIPILIITADVNYDRLHALVDVV